MPHRCAFVRASSIFAFAGGLILAAALLRTFLVAVGQVLGHNVRVRSPTKTASEEGGLPPPVGGLQCIGGRGNGAGELTMPCKDGYVSARVCRSKPSNPVVKYPQHMHSREQRAVKQYTNARENPMQYAQQTQRIQT